jgi:hypothetical protein
MLNTHERAEMLARAGPAFVVTLSEMAGDGWIFIPQDAVDLAILSRRKDRMQLGMLPGRYDSMPRFEFSPFIRIDAITHTLAGLGIIAPRDRRIAHSRNHGAGPGNDRRKCDPAADPAL